MLSTNLENPAWISEQKNEDFIPPERSLVALSVSQISTIEVLAVLKESLTKI